MDSPLELIGAKQFGAHAATGDIIMFFDCHVKPVTDYWVPYVKNIQQNYKRVVIPTVTNLDVDAWEEFGQPSALGSGMSKCSLTFDAEFKWTTDETPYVPIMSGGLLVISQRWFFKIGGYDSTTKGWGGENIDQSLQIWRCGGEIVSAPESFVAHMWRTADPKKKVKYKIGAGDAINETHTMSSSTNTDFHLTPLAARAPLTVNLIRHIKHGNLPLEGWRHYHRLLVADC